MAQAAEVMAVGIPGGFPNRDALAASRPDVLADTVADAVGQVLGG